ARWATPREIRRAGLMATHGVVVGRLGRQILCDDSETHVLLMGPTRSKKGVGVIIPTLLTWGVRHVRAMGQGASALILDPKDGENCDVTAPWRSQWGDIAAFTPCRAPQTCINVGDTIRFRTPQEFGDALTIGQSLTAPEKLAKESAVSLHFRELAAMLLTTALLHVGYTTGRCSLARVWHFLTQQYRSLGAALKAMATTAHVSHGVHQAIASLTTAIQNISGDRELSSVWTTAIRPLVLYNDPLIAASTDSSTINLEDLQYGSRPLSLYLVAPSVRSLERLHPLYRVIIEVALARLTEHKVRTWRHRLLFCADELPAYGYCRASEKGAADMAGYGQKALFVTQDLDQFQDVYGEKNAIWGNTEVKIFTAPTNDLTAKRISENLMGRGTVDHPVESRQAGLSGRQSVSFGHVGRPLLTTDEVMELDPRLQLVRMSGIKPMLCEKVDYRHDREYRGRWS
ncbi:MAG TPA: type IV secretory system conjugative DNA transfer family protein, partial [Candidatus Saccharimonadia bacterium]|nr:type IV secretory system conjugative DNA transfer family protein [Candidatus Saccharimonadia bacterium]